MIGSGVGSRACRRLRIALGVACLLLVATLMTALAGVAIPQLLCYGSAVVLLWLLPAVVWATVIQGDVLGRIAGGTGLAFVCSGLATLVLHLIPGSFPTVVAPAVYGLLVWIPLLMRCRAGGEGGGPFRGRQWVAVLVVVAVATLARVPNLGYSEFQGDEAVIMKRAAEALAGDDQELYLHQKGPVEILIPMSLWALTGTVNEWQVRLPFALAGLLSVLVVMVLAGRWFGPYAGFIAGSLIAINGFLVAFSRIVQYQNLVVAMGGLAVLMLLRYRDSGKHTDLVLGAAFLGFGLLAHYDAILWAPSAAVIGIETLTRSRLKGWVALKHHLGGWAGAALVGAAILGLFYVPFVRDPMFARTFSYLAGGRVGQGLFHNSLMSVWRMSTFYNALVYVVALAALVALAAGLRLGSLAAWFNFAVPFVFYCFVVSDPRTHVYTFYPGAAILAGGALARVLSAAPRKWRPILCTGAGLGYALCAGYIVVAFLNHQVEYKRAWPDSRHVLYPVPFKDDELPPYGHFGFPYQAGWKAVESLFAEGVLQGTYASNEEPEITTWYVRSGVRTMCGQPDTYIVAEDVQDEVALDWDALDGDYSLVAQVTVGGHPKIGVYSRKPVGAGRLSLDAQAYGLAFDAGTTVASQLPFGYGLQTIGDYSAGQSFGDVARLLGYDLSELDLHSGGGVLVTLYWQALSSPQRNYQVFTHLIGDDGLVAQDDSAPACAQAPTSLWEVGEVIRDEHRIALGEDLSPGKLDLSVGMYDLLSFDRLPVEGELVDHVVLTILEVQP